MQQRARNAEALLLAERQYPVPVGVLVEPRRQRRQSDRISTSRDLRPANVAGSAG